MKCEILNPIIKSFDQTWSCSPIHGGIEITVPYVATNGDLIKLKLINKKDVYIVEDDFYISNSLEESDKDLSMFKTFQRHYLNYFHIEQEHFSNGTFKYYKSTKNVKALSSIVFDLSQFLAAVRSFLGINFYEERGEETFFKKAKQYIDKNISEVDSKKLAYRSPIEYQGIKFTFGAIGVSKKNLYNAAHFVTGSTESNFENSINRGSAIFSLTKKWPNINNRIAVLNDEAPGYSPNHPSSKGFLTLLGEHTSQEPLLWSRHKNKFLELIVQ